MSPSHFRPGIRAAQLNPTFQNQRHTHTQITRNGTPPTWPTSRRTQKDRESQSLCMLLAVSVSHFRVFPTLVKKTNNEDIRHAFVGILLHNLT